MPDFSHAQQLIMEFKGDHYLHGIDVLSQTGVFIKDVGKQAILIVDRFPGSETWLGRVRASLANAGMEILAELDGASPNAPREDLARITYAIRATKPEVILSFGGGSTIDCVKAAGVLSILGGNVDEYFGIGLVTWALEAQGKALLPHVAIQTASSSGAHLTKYSNITDIKVDQKKLIVDEAIVPPKAVFDYSTTYNAPVSLTVDGALDGISHALEVLYNSYGKSNYVKTEAVSLEAIELAVTYLPQALDNPHDSRSRQGLGLATDLGAYAIMLGGTSGAHLTSFSLVSILSHGRACGLLNPYYTVFYAPAIEEPLRRVGEIYWRKGYMNRRPDGLSGRELGIAVAQGMIAFEQSIAFPTRLNDIPGFQEALIDKALTAAKDPQLKMKLENMPVPLTAEMVDEYMGPVLQAAMIGDLEAIKNVP